MHILSNQCTSQFKKNILSTVLQLNYFCVLMSSTILLLSPEHYFTKSFASLAMVSEGQPHPPPPVPSHTKPALSGTTGSQLSKKTSFSLKNHPFFKALP